MTSLGQASITDFGSGEFNIYTAMLLYTPAAGLVTVAVWLATVLFTRVSAMGALVAFAALPLAIWGFAYEWEKLFLSAIISILLFIRHITNIKQMLERSR